jgi:sRNA-binding regulator protein Hfq
VEPAVAAALDAVTRWLLYAAFPEGAGESPARQDRLEAMRHFVLDAASDTAPAAARRPHGEETETSAGEAALDAGGLRTGHGSAPAAVTSPHRFELVHNGDNRPQAYAAGAEPALIAKGGSEMRLQQDPPDGASAGRAARAPGVEDAFYRSLVSDRTPVHLRCRDGYEVPRAIVRDAGTYALLVETPGGLELFFKHAIISIRVLPAAGTQA